MTNKNNYCTLYIARHGETEWNVEHRFQGQMDSPLTANGLKQAEDLAKELKVLHFDAIFSSDLLRAKRTAEIVALERDLAVTTTQILREQSYGSLEGKLIMEAKAELSEIFEEYERLPDDKKYHHSFVEGMESDEMIASRMITYVREISIAYSGKQILLVCHGSIMAAFLVHIGFGKQDKVRIANTGYFVLQSDGADFFVKDTSGVRIIE